MGNHAINIWVCLTEPSVSKKNKKTLWLYHVRYRSIDTTGLIFSASYLTLQTQEKEQ